MAKSNKNLYQIFGEDICLNFIKTTQLNRFLKGVLKLNISTTNKVV